jgi:hypothetical protein
VTPRDLTDYLTVFPAGAGLPPAARGVWLGGMKAFFLAGLCGAAALLAGCGTMLDGKLYALGEQATLLPFQIELSRGAGKMNAENPATGEKFAGTYAGVYHRDGGTVVVNPAVTPANAVGRGFEQGVAAAAARPTRASAKGVLIGDKGTVIEIALDITPGLRPHGVGEGFDNKGRRYQVQF